ncbi:hypothetical protein D3C71_21350 [compost metagenome]
MNDCAQATPFSPSRELAELISQAESMTRRHTRHDWSASLLNVPLLLLTYGLVQLSEEDTKELAVTPMPDSWVVQAAALPAVAPSSLQRLRKALKANGFVSIRDANDFCSVECAREQLRHDQAQRQARQEAAAGGQAMAALSQRLDALGAGEVQFSPSAAAQALLQRAQGLAEGKTGAVASAVASVIEKAKRLGA